MHKAIFILVVFFTTFGVSQSKMTNTEASKLRAVVKKQAATTQTIVSDFTQYKHLDFLTDDIVTEGKLAFKSPDKVKWEYIKPYKYSVIFKGETLYVNDEGNKSEVDLGSSKLFKQLNKLIINSVKGDMFDDKEFIITYLNLENSTEKEVVFIPTNEKLIKYIASFVIRFNKEGEVLSVKMVEPSKDYTRIVFSNRTLNTTLGNAVFTH